MEEGVDTVGNGVLLLFRGQDVFLHLGWRRVLTQLVTGCCCCLEDMTLFLRNLGWRRVLTQLLTGCCCCLEDKTVLEILGGGGC